MTKIIKLIYIFSILSITTIALAASQHDDVNKYVDGLVSEAQLVLNNTQLTDKERSNKSKTLIAANLDLDWMAKYTLGRYRKGLIQTQQQEFAQTYSEYVVKIYSDLIKNYKGEKAKIKQVQPLDTSEFIVKTEVVRVSGQPPIKVDYLVRSFTDNGTTKFRIFDVITEGISMINSQQSEFSSILADSDITNLIATLKKKL